MDAGYYRETLLLRLKSLHRMKLWLPVRINEAPLSELFAYNPEATLFERQMAVEACLPLAERECREAGIDEATLRRAAVAR